MKKGINAVRRAVLATLPIMAGYLTLGFGFGVIMFARGYPVWMTLLMSTVIYAGSMQYVAVDLLSGGTSLLAAALTTLLVNARHLFYGISMVDAYKNAGWRKPYLIFALTDETYALLCNERGRTAADQRHYFLVSLLDQIYWIVGSVLGAVLGPMLPFSTQGIDFTLTALFVTIFVEQWLSVKKHLPAVIGVSASVLCLGLFGSEHFLIPSMVLIFLAIALLHQKEAWVLD